MVEVRGDKEKKQSSESQETLKKDVEKRKWLKEKMEQLKKIPLKNIAKVLFATIQTLANLAVVITLIFAIFQYMDTKEPLENNIKLKKAERYYNLGDYEEAAKRYEELASNNIPEALNNLAYMHYRGLGVKQDIAKARDLYWDAYLNGSSLAINNLILLSYEHESEESKEDLAKIYNIAYQTKNEDWMATAISYITVTDVDDIDHLDIRSGKYDYIFEGGVEDIAERLRDPANQYEIDRWKAESVLYLPHAGAAYTGESRKMVYQGAVSGNDVEGEYGIYYKYVIYTRGMKSTDNLTTGIERILDIEKTE